MLVAMSETDPAMVEIGKGIELSQAGERATARQVFADLWTRIGPAVTRSIAAPWPTPWPMFKTTRLSDGSTPQRSRTNRSAWSTPPNSSGVIIPRRYDSRPVEITRSWSQRA